jgi:peptidoglycan/xylan/chitin deacetylase (PgdA/CDA1 family)
MSRSAQAAELLAVTGGLGVLERLPAWRGVLVLNYHRIGDPEASSLDRGLFSATPAQFDAQMRHLAARADVIPLEHVPAVLETGRGRKVVLTFDDGYRDNHEHALPVLLRYGLPATFFLATGFLDQPSLSWWDEAAWLLRQSTVSTLPGVPGVLPETPLDDDAARERAISAVVETYKRLPAARAELLLSRVRDAALAPPYDGPALWMTWDMARDLRDAGMGVGGHTVDHPVLANVDDDRLVRELDGCASRLLDELGVQMTTFAYPVGRSESFDQRSVDHLRRRGVRIACTFDGGHAQPGRTDLLRLPRASVTADMSLPSVRLRTALPQRFARW